jgi:hypothetical protein
MRDMGLTPKKMVLKRAIFKQLQYAVKSIKRQELICQTSLTKYRVRKGIAAWALMVCW